MESIKDIKRLLIEHFGRYTEAEVVDAFKLLHQSAFGCGHLSPSREGAAAYIREELAAIKSAEDSIERLGGGFSRVGLGWLSLGLSADTLARLLCRSAERRTEGEAWLCRGLTALTEAVAEGLLPFDGEELSRAIEAWRLGSFPPVHHSERYRRAYSPAYRVIANEYTRLLPLLSKLDERLAAGDRVTLAIEGGAASGKTTLAALLFELYGCAVFHADDFFLRPEQRTPERLSEAGGNLDRERLLSEVLLPLKRGDRVITYSPFNCSTRSLDTPVSVTPSRLTVVEGAYSMHPELADCYDLSVYLEIDPASQRERIKKRNSPKMAERFFNEWIPLERHYFDFFDIKERCSLSIAPNPL